MFIINNKIFNIFFQVITYKYNRQVPNYFTLPIGVFILIFSFKSFFFESVDLHFVKQFGHCLIDKRSTDVCRNIFIEIIIIINYFYNVYIIVNNIFKKMKANISS